MALLNPPEISPQIVRFIHRYLRTRPKATADIEMLVANLAPDSVGKPSHVRSTLKMCTEIGLTTESDGKISLSDQINSKLRRRGGDQLLRREVRRLIMASTQMAGEWGSQAGCRDFLVASAWRLGLPSPGSGGTWPRSQKLQHQDFSDVTRPLKNDTRWGSLCRWETFLGLGLRQSQKNIAQFQLADPTEALAEELPDLFGQQTEWSSADFVSALAQKIPVLDGGLVRQEVEDHLKREVEQEAGLLSMSFSVALGRLEQRGLLQIVDRADTDKLRRHVGAGSVAFSHIAKGR